MKHVICPTVLAQTESEFAEQIKNVADFAHRIQIDLMDGKFASPKSVGLDKVWWPANITADIHLMYENPMDSLSQLLHLKPSMVIIHAEADVHHMHMAAELHAEGIDAGLAVLPETPILKVEQILNSFDHLLIFSGDLGKFGGDADLGMLEKAKQALEHHPDLEIGWDGGVKPAIAAKLAAGGVNVLNTGGFVQKSDNPQAAFEQLAQSIA